MDIIKENERLKAENEKLRKELQKFKGGGRPSKFTDEEKASIEMYRLQGKTMKKCAEKSMLKVLRILQKYVRHLISR